MPLQGKNLMNALKWLDEKTVGRDHWVEVRPRLWKKQQDLWRLHCTVHVHILHEVESLSTYSKKSKVCFFNMPWKTCFKKKVSHTTTIHLEKILWGTNTSACARKPYCVFPFKLRVLKTSPVAVRQLGEFVCHQFFASQKGRHFQIRGLR